MENEENQKQNPEGAGYEGQKPPFPPKDPWGSKPDFGHPAFQPHHPNPRLAGLIVLIVGLVLLLNRIPQTAQWLPGWLFTWPVIVIVIGIFIGVKHRFRNSFAWIIPVVIGLVFLLKDEINLPEAMQDITVPLLVILAGIVIMFNRRRYRRCPYPQGQQFRQRRSDFRNTHHRGRRARFTENSTEDFIDVNSTFGNVVKKVVSKKFRGGNINCSFGGTELDLTQSDIQETVALNLSVTFGGVEIAIPSNWNVKNDISVIFGGVEDKRRQVNNAEDAPKTLILTGNITCGGLELKN
jgi:predicted membrane protein